MVRRELQIKKKEEAKRDNELTDSTRLSFHSLSSSAVHTERDIWLKHYQIIELMFHLPLTNIDFHFSIFSSRKQQPALSCTFKSHDGRRRRSRRGLKNDFISRCARILESDRVKTEQRQRKILVKLDTFFKSNYGLRAARIDNRNVHFSLALKSYLFNQNWDDENFQFSAVFERRRSFDW